jgi:hypothetical protein
MRVSTLEDFWKNSHAEAFKTACFQTIAYGRKDRLSHNGNNFIYTDKKGKQYNIVGYYVFNGQGYTYIAL